MQKDAANRLRILGINDVRETNELKLVHLIRDRQPVSRADVVKATGLRPGTISVIVNRLLRASIIHEGEVAPSSGGRPPTYLQINAEKAYVVGISIGVRQTTYGVSDFNGRLLNQQTTGTEADGRAFLTHLGREIARQLKTNFPRTRFGAVGVSVPGLIDRVNGCLIRSPNLHWNDIPIVAILENELHLPVHVENDANAAALSELWYGPMELWGTHCILFVLIVEGIGTGLILNGEVYGGSRIGMGGFGHIPFDSNGPVCSCGSVGCWEMLASDDATLRRFASTRKSSGKPVNSLYDLVALAQSGDSGAREELIATAAYIGQGIKALAQGLAPEVIVIGGQITAGWPIVEPILQDALQGEYLIPGISRPQIRPATVEHPAFFGAFSVALRSVLHKRKKLQSRA